MPEDSTTSTRNEDESFEFDDDPKNYIDLSVLKERLDAFTPKMHEIVSEALAASARRHLSSDEVHILSHLGADVPPPLSSLERQRIEAMNIHTPLADEALGPQRPSPHDHTESVENWKRAQRAEHRLTMTEPSPSGAVVCEDESPPQMHFCQQCNWKIETLSSIRCTAPAHGRRDLVTGIRSFPDCYRIRRPLIAEGIATCPEFTPLRPPWWFRSMDAAFLKLTSTLSRRGKRLLSPPIGKPTERETLRSSSHREAPRTGTPPDPVPSGHPPIWRPLRPILISLTLAILFLLLDIKLYPSHEPTVSYLIFFLLLLLLLLFIEPPQPRNPSR